MTLQLVCRDRPLITTLWSGRRSFSGKRESPELLLTVNSWTLNILHLFSPFFEDCQMKDFIVEINALFGFYLCYRKDGFILTKICFFYQITPYLMILFPLLEMNYWYSYNHSWLPIIILLLIFLSSSFFWSIIPKIFISVLVLPLPSRIFFPQSSDKLFLYFFRVTFSIFLFPRFETTLYISTFVGTDILIVTIYS